MLISNKPSVDLWFNSLDVSPIGTVNSGFIGDKGIGDPYQDIVHNFFIKHIQNYCELNIKTINKDKVNHHHINIAPIVCPTVDNLHTAIKSVDDSLYKYCEENKIVLLLSLIRETVGNSRAAETVSLVKEYIIAAGYNPQVIKISHLAFKNCTSLSDVEDYMVNIDYFSRILADVVTTKYPNIKFAAPIDRTYKFSVLTGLLAYREYRAIFLAKCYDMGLLDNDVFLTMVLPNDNDISYIKEIFSDWKYRDIIFKACDELFKNITVDINGDVLLDKTIYDDFEEFMVPLPVMDSYVNIVLETQLFTPSLTEKIYKPLMAGLIFFWHGPINTMQYLESLGFKRYKHIDYSFDIHEDCDERLDLLVKEIQRLKKKDLKVLVKLNKDIIEHNQKNFWKISSNMNDLWTKLK